MHKTDLLQHIKYQTEKQAKRNCTLTFDRRVFRDEIPKSNIELQTNLATTSLSTKIKCKNNTGPKPV